MLLSIQDLKVSFRRGEGRRADVIERLAEAIRAVAGVRLLDYSSDPSHNRSVFSIAGTPSALESAVLALATTAVSAIDLRQHQGVHPRIGAVDVQAGDSAVGHLRRPLHDRAPATDRRTSRGTPLRRGLSGRRSGWPRR